MPSTTPMTELQAYNELRRSNWPDTLAEALAHPVWGKLIRARLTVANRKRARKATPERFDYKRAQANDID